VITPNSSPAYLGVPSDRATAVVVQPDGKIVVGGISNFYSADSTAVLIRYDSDGSLDTTFGTGGEVTGQLGLATVTGLALDGNEIVVGGTTLDDFGRDSFVVDLLKPDGSPDAAFGQGGTSIANISPNSGDETDAIAVGNGLIYAGGATLTAGAPYKQFAVVAFSPTGAVVSQPTVNFNNANGASEAWGLAIQPGGGKVVASGFGQVHASGGSVVVHGALVRFNPDLALDTSFGNNGLVSPDLGPGASALGNPVIQSDGQTALLNNGFGVIRYNTDGSLDSTFSTASVSLPIVGNTPIGEPTGLALEADGNLVAVGTYASPTYDLRFTVAR
jgi:uncharacterized delta-60 repeat protein